MAIHFPLVSGGAQSATVGRRSEFASSLPTLDFAGRLQIVRGPDSAPALGLRMLRKQLRKS